MDVRYIHVATALSTIMMTIAFLRTSNKITDNNNDSSFNNQLIKVNQSKII